MISKALAECPELAGPQLREAEEEARRSGRRLEDVVLERGLLSKDALLALLSKAWGVPVAKAHSLEAWRAATRLVPASFCRSSPCFPLVSDGKTLTVALAKPDPLCIDSITIVTGLKVSWEVALAADIMDAIDRTYGKASGRGIRLDPEPHRDDRPSPAVGIVNVIFQRAMKSNAPEMRLEAAGEKRFVVIWMIGGAAQSQELPATYRKAIAARIKIMAKMDIQLTDKPQKGRIVVKYKGQEAAWDVETKPSPDGEGFILRRAG